MYFTNDSRYVCVIFASDSADPADSVPTWSFRACFSSLKMSSSDLTILDIPPELAEQVLICMHPVDLAHLGQTCKALHTLTNDTVIWRRLFQLYPFDDLREALQVFGGPEMSPNWKHALQCRVKAERIAHKPGTRVSEHRFALETFVSVIQTALPYSEDQPTRTSSNLNWLVHLLSTTSILSITIRSKDPDIVSLASRLRTYFALSLEDARRDDVASQLKAIRTKSRCFVYDLRNYRRVSNVYYMRNKTYTDA